MRLQVKGRNVEVTDSIREYAEEKLGRLERQLPEATQIEVERLDPDPRGNELELTWNGSELALTIDDLPAEPSQASALERVAAARVSGMYAAHAHRVRGDLWELSVLAL